MSKSDATGVISESKLVTPMAKLPSFDGWRAISILLVLISHVGGVTGFAGPRLSPLLPLLGDLGVRFFFTISGFLITWLLLVEFKRTGFISLKNFYIRRAFRILPVYAVFLATLFLLQSFTPYHQSAGQWIANLTFTTNYVPPPWCSAHLWSLGVEEQFYLLWPVLLVGLGLTTNLKRTATVLAVPLIVSPVFRLIAYKGYYPQALSFLFLHSSFFRYFDTLAIGCGCAMIAFWNQERMHKMLSDRITMTLVIALATFFLPFGLLAAHAPGRIQEAVVYSLQAFGFALLLLQSVFLPELKGYKCLNWAWVRHIGVLSYSIYIWQQIFTADPRLLGFGSAKWIGSPMWWLALLAAAHLSYYGLERPFLRIRDAFRNKGRKDQTADGRNANSAKSPQPGPVGISTN